MNNIPHIVDTGASPIEPAGWIGYQEGHLVSFLKTQKQVNSFLTATDPTGRVEPVYTHPVKELNDGGEPVKNATYWKRQYNLMATQNDNLKSGLYHANEQIKYFESHPVKELNEAIKIIKDFQNSDVPPCRDYENTYADGWIDACNEILWAIEEKAQEK